MGTLAHLQARSKNRRRFAGVDEAAGKVGTAAGKDAPAGGDAAAVTKPLVSQMERGQMVTIGNELWAITSKTPKTGQEGKYDYMIRKIAAVGGGYEGEPKRFIIPAICK